MRFSDILLMLVAFCRVHTLLCSSEVSIPGQGALPGLAMVRAEMSGEYYKQHFSARLCRCQRHTYVVCKGVVTGSAQVI